MKNKAELARGSIMDVLIKYAHSFSFNQPELTTTVRDHQETSAKGNDQKLHK